MSCRVEKNSAQFNFELLRLNILPFLCLWTNGKTKVAVLMLFYFTGSLFLEILLVGDAAINEVVLGWARETGHI